MTTVSLAEYTDRLKTIVNSRRRSGGNVIVNQMDVTRWQFVINAVLPGRPAPKLSKIINNTSNVKNGRFSW